MKRWQDWVNVVLGAWLVISPWALGFADPEGPASWSAWVLGAAVVIFAASAVYIPKAWEEGINILLGLGLAVSPWLLGFADREVAANNAVIVGILIAAFAIWAMVLDASVQSWWQKRHQTR